MTRRGTMPENSGHFSALFVELGLIIAGLAVLARLAKRYGISAIPLYLAIAGPVLARVVR